MSFTANPRADNPQKGSREPTGPITSDSLAAESLRRGEGFADNENAAQMDVRGSNSTLNTTDTSGATALHSARDGATREKLDALGLGADEKGPSGVKYPEGAGGQGQFDGVHSQQGFAGGSRDTPRTGNDNQTGFSGASGDSFVDGGAGLTGDSSTKASGISSSGPGSIDQGSGRRDETTTNRSTSDRQGNEPLATGRAGEDYHQASRPDSDTAPNYAATVSGAIQSQGYGKPKGKNLHEGDLPETKTFTGNVGGQHDPGRLAEQSFQKMDADDMVSAGGKKYGGSGQESSTGGVYDALSSDRAPDRNY